jgi:hypothetical protein
MTFSQQLGLYGITSLWNVSHLNNLASIMRYGITSRYLCQSLNLTSTDISNQYVQQRREISYDENLNEFYPHKYVPLFLTDNTPMLYVTSSEDGNVILLELSTEVADRKDIYFSDANIASNDHHLYSDSRDLAYLDWDIILSRQPAFGREWKANRSAEVLIPNCCESAFITGVHVQPQSIENIRIADLVRAIIDLFPNMTADVYEDLTPRGVW